MTKDKLLTSVEVCEMLQISKPTLVALKKRAGFPKPFRPGNKDLWKESEIEEYLESTRQGSKTDGAEGKN